MNYPENLIHEANLSENIRTENEPTCLLGFLEFYSQVNASFLSDKNKEKLFARYADEFSFPVNQVRTFIDLLRTNTEFSLRNNLDLPFLLELKQLVQRDNYHIPLTPKYFFDIEIQRHDLPDEMREFIEKDYYAFVSLYIDNVILSENHEIDDELIESMLKCY